MTWNRNGDDEYRSMCRTEVIVASSCRMSTWSGFSGESSTYGTGEPGEETSVIWTVLHGIEEFDRVEANGAKCKDSARQVSSSGG